jgi:hypothetical protein
MNLLIDDCKTFPDMDIIARNYKAGIEVLRTGIVTVLHLDFDLGEEKTGADILKAGFFEVVIPNDVRLISLNPSGLEEMKAILRDNGFINKTNRNFVRK